MLRIYDTKHVQLNPLINYSELCFEDSLKDKCSISFKYPIRDERAATIKLEGYIRANNNEYIIKEIKRTEDYLEVYAELNLEELDNTFVENFSSETQTIETCLTQLLRAVNSPYSISYCDSSITKKRTITADDWVTVRSIIDEAKSIYNAEITYNTIDKKISIYQQIGNQKGTYFFEDLNLKELTIEEETHDIVTRLYPIGKDDLTIHSVNNNVPYIENHSYTDKIICGIWSDERYTDAQALLDDAKAKLKTLCKPQISFSASIVDLRALGNGSYNYALGDVITLVHKSSGTREKQRIVSMKQYPQEPEKNTCTLSNEVSTLVDYAVDSLNMKNEIKRYGKIITYIEQTGKDISLRVEQLGKTVSEIKESVDGISISYDGAEAGTASITIGKKTVTLPTEKALDDSEKTIKEYVTKEIAAINLNGYVTFTSLAADGETVINGGNVSTGTIASADYNTTEKPKSYWNLDTGELNLGYNGEQYNLTVDKDGNVKVNGNITFTNEADIPQVKVLYGAQHFVKPGADYDVYPDTGDNWHKTFVEGEDFYITYNFESGKAAYWQEAIKFVGTDGANGKDGADGADGSDANVPAYIKSTYIDFSSVQSPNIKGNDIDLMGGTFTIKDITGNTTYGELGRGSGNDGAGATTGIVMKPDDSHYIIATSKGVRMQSGNYSIYAIDSGVYATDGSHKVRLDTIDTDSTGAITTVAVFG